MNDEILEAVALAIADLRREQSAALDALRAEHARSIDAMQTEHHALAEQLRQAAAAEAEVRAELAARLDATAARTDVDALRESVAEGVELVESMLTRRAMQSELDAVRASVETVADALADLDRRAAGTDDALQALTQTFDLDSARVTGHLTALAGQIEARVTGEQLQDVHDILADALGRRATHEQVAAVREYIDASCVLRDDVATLVPPIDLAPLHARIDACATHREIKELRSEQAATLAGYATVEQVHNAVEALEADAAAIRTETALALDESVLEVEHAAKQALDAATAAIRADLTQCVRSDTIQSLRDEVREWVEQRALPPQIDEVFERTAARMRDEIVRRYQGAETWLRGGAGYQAYALVRHDGALWQSLKATEAVPGDSPDWVLLADGVKGVELRQTTPGRATLIVSMSSGRQDSVDFRLPVPSFKGVYDPAAEYVAWDTVAKDGHVFLCLAHQATGAPGANPGEWQVFSGPRGRAGKTIRLDERAVVDTVLREVIPQIQQVIERMPA